MSTPTTNLFDELPGELMIWVLIVSELLVFGTGLVTFMALRAMDPETFAQSQDLLNRTAGAINTIVLVISGFCAAKAAQNAGRFPARTRAWIGAACGLGALFLAIKYTEYAEKTHMGIGVETNDFFTFYYLLTGFHAMHVVAGLVIFGLLLIRPTPGNVNAGTSFWHMVDLVWVLLFPIIYIL